MYAHSVYFTYKPDMPESAMDAMIADVNELLAAIPTVKCINAGRRDPNAQREVNDKDFHVGLLVCFEDAAAHDEYQIHPAHKEFVAKHKDNWESIRVFDFISG